MDGASHTTQRTEVRHTPPTEERRQGDHAGAAPASHTPTEGCPRRGGRRFPSGYLVPGVVATGALAVGLLGGIDAHRAAGPAPAQAATPSVSVQAPASSLPAPSLSCGSLLVRLPWGDGPAEVGLAAPTEGVTRGPEAMAVRADGSVVLLDSVNHRLLVLDPAGSVTATIPVPLASPRFLAVDEDRAFVLDADEDRSLTGFDAAGRVVGRVAIARPDEPVTGLFLRAGRPLVETGHGRVAALPDVAAQQVPSEPGRAGAPPAVALEVLAKVPGRPAAGGGWLSARFAPGSAPAVEVSGPSGAVQRRWLPLDPALPIEHLIALAADDQGRVILGARLLGRGGAEKEDEPVFLLARWGTASGGPSPGVTDALLLRESLFAEVGDPFVVAPNGAIYQPFPEASGLAILVHRFPDGGGR